MSLARPVLIAGPTASGKSALARKFALDRPSVIVNADSMQVYSGLRILTARPTIEEEASVPHRLYAHVPPGDRYSVGRWLTDVAAVLLDAEGAGLRPIIVGGTGLYFRALTEGLAAIPPVPAEVRAAVNAQAADRSTAELHAELSARAPSEGLRLRATDRARVLRALEVLAATGRPLAEWQAGMSRPLVDPEAAERIILMPDRPVLHRRIDARLLEMIEQGALEEARAMGALGLDENLPAMKAIGLRPLLLYLRGRLTLDEAIFRAQAETRQYAKRQITWFRNQAPGWRVSSSPLPGEVG